MDEVSANSSLKVTSASDMEAMLGLEQQKDLLGCSDVSCMAQIAGALGVDALLSVKLGKLGETYRLSSTLIHIQQARALVRASVTYKGKPDGLIGVVEALVRKTMAPVRQ